MLDLKLGMSLATKLFKSIPFPISISLYKFMCKEPRTVEILEVPVIFVVTKEFQKITKENMTLMHFCIPRQINTHIAF